MKKRYIILWVGVLLAVAAFAANFVAQSNWNAHCAAKSKDIYGWLKHEFGLTQDQVDKIKAIDAAFEPICAGHCQAITAAQQALEKQPDSIQAKENLAQKQAECHTGLIAHLKDVAAAMPSKEGQRYYAMMITQLECMGSMGEKHMGKP